MNPDKTQTIDFRETQMEEAGNYRCILENKVGTAEASCNLMVAGMTSFNQSLNWTKAISVFHIICHKIYYHKFYTDC